MTAYLLGSKLNEHPYQCRSSDRHGGPDLPDPVLRPFQPSSHCPTRRKARLSFSVGQRSHVDPELCARGVSAAAALLGNPDDIRMACRTDDNAAVWDGNSCS